MACNRLHRIIVGGVAGILLFCIAGAWFLVSGTSLFFAFVCAVVAVSFAFKLVNLILAQFKDNQNKLEERRRYIESIVRVLTHETGNSLTPIISLSDDLMKHTGEYDNEGIADVLQTINQQALQLMTFLNAYHRLAHLPDPVMARVKARALFDTLRRLLSSEPGSKNIRYAPAENIVIRMDQKLVTLALLNLIRNALQATAHRPDPQIRVEARREASSACILITDNGACISPDRLEDIFQPFYSTKPEGSGIGLPLSRRIMQLHGGELTATSTPEEGTTFKMTFSN